MVKIKKPFDRIKEIILKHRLSSVVLFAAIFLLGGLIIYLSTIVINPLATRVSNSSKNVAKVVDDATLLAHKGKIDEAVALYESSIKAASVASVKEDLLIGEATIYFNNLDYDNAMTTAKKAEAISGNKTVYLLIAQIFESKKDNINAVVYYKKAIALMVKLTATSASEKQYYKDKVIALGGVND